MKFNKKSFPVPGPWTVVFLISGALFFWTIRSLILLLF